MSVDRAQTRPLRARYAARGMKGLPLPALAEQAFHTLAEALTQKLPEPYDPTSPEAGTGLADLDAAIDVDAWETEPPF
jgi:hypothetical protein